MPTTAGWECKEKRPDNLPASSTKDGTVKWDSIGHLMKCYSKIVTRNDIDNENIDLRMDSHNVHTVPEKCISH